VASSLQTLPNNQGLDYGQDYTFSFKLSAWLATVDIGDISSAVAQLQDLGSPSVQESTSGALGLNLAGGIWDVSFTFQGDDSVATVATVAQEISAAVSSTHSLVSFDLVGAFTGSSGLVGSGSADAGLNAVKNTADDFSKDFLYIGIALVLVIVVIKFL